VILGIIGIVGFIVLTHSNYLGLLDWKHLSELVANRRVAREQSNINASVGSRSVMDIGMGILIKVQRKGGMFAQTATKGKTHHVVRVGLLDGGMANSSTYDEFVIQLERELDTASV